MKPAGPVTAPSQTHAEREGSESRRHSFAGRVHGKTEAKTRRLNGCQCVLPLPSAAAVVECRQRPTSIEISIRINMGT